MGIIYFTNLNNAVSIIPNCDGLVNMMIALYFSCGSGCSTSSSSSVVVFVLLGRYAVGQPPAQYQEFNRTGTATWSTCSLCATALGCLSIWASGHRRRRRCTFPKRARRSTRRWEMPSSTTASSACHWGWQCFASEDCFSLRSSFTLRPRPTSTHPVIGAREKGKTSFKGMLCVGPSIPHTLEQALQVYETRRREDQEAHVVVSVTTAAMFLGEGEVVSAEDVASRLSPLAPFKCGVVLVLDTSLTDQFRHALQLQLAPSLLKCVFVPSADAAAELLERMRKEHAGPPPPPRRALCPVAALVHSSRFVRQGGSAAEALWKCSRGGAAVRGVVGVDSQRGPQAAKSVYCLPCGRSLRGEG